ncbi:MAG: hypothetical protein HBSAPP03_03300 [Phycisphaerae bacterium]|nr:MAG: hypothetical protein HBSAPP03_03300 [Phycisphaerae bacterium]
MRKRLIMGPILIAALVAGLWADQAFEGAALPAWPGRVPPGGVILLVMIAVVLLAAREVTAVLVAKGVRASRGLTAFAAMVGLASWVFALHAGSAVAAMGMATGAVLVMVVSAVCLIRNRMIEGVVSGVAGALFAFAYLGVMFGFLLAIRTQGTAWVLLWVLLVTKSCDIGAYFTGKAIGKHKMIPWLSPGKTWEGLAGGVVVAAGVSAGGMWLLLKDDGMSIPGVWWALFPGVVFAVVGQAGDLLESVLKRDAGMKDSGATVPGMGGVLDVIDSPLLVGPAAYWLLRWYAEAGIFSGKVAPGATALLQ